MQDLIITDCSSIPTQLFITMLSPLNLYIEPYLSQPHDAPSTSPGPHTRLNQVLPHTYQAGNGCLLERVQNERIGLGTC